MTQTSDQYLAFLTEAFTTPKKYKCLTLSVILRNSSKQLGGAGTPY